MASSAKRQCSALDWDGGTSIDVGSKPVGRCGPAGLASLQRFMGIVMELPAGFKFTEDPEHGGVPLPHLSEAREGSPSAR